MRSKRLRKGLYVIRYNGYYVINESLTFNYVGLFYY